MDYSVRSIKITSHPIVNGRNYTVEINVSDQRVYSYNGIAIDGDGMLTMFHPPRDFNTRDEVDDDIVNTIKELTESA